MEPNRTPDEVRRSVATSLTDEEALALADWYTGIAQAVAKFPEAELKEVEPPLRSVPGP